MTKPKHFDPEAYAQDGCPVCGDKTQELSYSSVSIEDGGAYQDVSCGCGATWTEVYHFVGILLYTGEGLSEDSEWFYRTAEG